MLGRIALPARESGTPLLPGGNNGSFPFFSSKFTSSVSPHLFPFRIWPKPSSLFFLSESGKRIVFFPFVLGIEMSSPRFTLVVGQIGGERATPLSLPLSVEKPFPFLFSLSLSRGVGVP